MTKFSDDHIRMAGIDDVPAIIALLNKAYRGDASKKGWTTEANLIAGDQRTNQDEVTALIHSSVYLIYIDAAIIEGCVNLQQHDNKIYLGMLSVNPELQGSGIGKKLLQASEEYALSKGCNSIYMTVIDVREELIHWYKRHGYADTGERKPFEEDGISGKHLQKLQFMVLEKEGFSDVS